MTTGGGARERETNRENSDHAERVGVKWDV